MTKTKKRKMSKSTFAIIIMAVVMVAMLAFGGSYAYFTATATARTGTATTGYVKLNSDETFQFTKTNVMPGDELIAAGAAKLTVDTTDAKGNYVAVQFVITAVEADGTTTIDAATLKTYGLSADSIIAASDTGWKAAGGSYTGMYIWGSAEGTPVAVKPDGGTTKTLTINASAFTLSKDVEDNWTQGSDKSDNKLMGATITFQLKAASIQASNLTDSATILQQLNTLLTSIN